MQPFSQNTYAKGGKHSLRSALRPFAANLVWQGRVLPGLLLPWKESENKEMTGRGGGLWQAKAEEPSRN